MKRTSRSTMTKIAKGVLLGLVAYTLLTSTSAGAQEDVTGPPPILQWPSAVSANPTGQLPFQVGAGGLRRTIEEAADLTLCERLMKDAKLPIPTPPAPPLTFATCPSSIKAMIDARQGSVAWAEGARPTECKRDCIGPPFMSESQNVDRPNSRYALVYGHLTFKVNVPLPYLPGSVDRNVTYFVEVDANCNMSGTPMSGAVDITSRVDGPVANDPSILESILNYVALPLEISNRIDDGIKNSYQVSTSSGNEGPCSSIGAFAAPADFMQGDAFSWDVPIRRPVNIDEVRVKPTATLYFDRIIRNHTIESNPSAQPLTFTLYINAMPAHIPRNDTISISPGARNEQKYCKTIAMSDVDRLQILFVDSLGGAVWSQFTPQQNFGAGSAHKMTTGRNYKTPGLHPGDKPQNFVLQEFELDYRVDFHPAPTSIAPPPPAAGGTRPGLPLPPRAVVALGDNSPPPDSSCTRI